MKNLLLFVIPLVFLFSCKNETKTTEESTQKVELIPEKVTLQGTIENPVSESAEIRGEGIVGMKGLKVDVVDGKFNMEFELTEPTNLTFIHGQESASLYLEPGDEVTMTLNPKQFDETIQLSGKGAEESNFLFKKYLLREGMGEMKDIFTLDKNAFAAKQNEIRDLIISNLEEHAKVNPDINPDFVDAQKNSTHYSWANNKMNYPGYYSYFTKEDEPDMGDDYFSFMNDINLNDEKAYKSDRNYSMLVQGFIRNGTSDIKLSLIHI